MSPPESQAPYEDGLPVSFKGKTLRIMPIGDSITTGGMSTNSYRERLIELLPNNTIDMVGSKSNGTMHPSERNRLEAVIGWTVDAAKRDLKQSLDKWRPNVVLVHLGTNDCGNMHELEKLPDKMRALLGMIESSCPDAAVLVARITPIAFRQGYVKDYNESVAKIVEERAAAGAHFLSVDMYGPFERHGHPNYLADVAHPNPLGHRLMAKIWAEGIQELADLGWIVEPVTT